MFKRWLIRLVDALDRAYLSYDRQHILRANNIVLIPSYSDRRGGKRSYAEWGHVIGIFQTLLYHL